MYDRVMRILVCRVLIPILAALAPFAQACAGETSHDRWYVIEMMGKRAGYMRDTGKTEGDRYTGRSETVLTIRRGAIALDISMDSEFVETLDGKPISMTHTQKMGARPTTKTYVFGPDDVEVTESQG